MAAPQRVAAGSPPRPAPYTDFTRQYIAGHWRAGGSTTSVVQDRNPYTDELLVELRGASAGDVDDAYAAAQAAQPAWAALLPRERAELLLRAARAFEARHDEIVDWLIREAGATHHWARMIASHAAVCCSEAAGYAQTPCGLLLPSLIANQRSVVHRKPVGVVALITSWNSPINLTLRALAPALALGNAVVLKPASETPVTGGLFHARVFEEVGLPAGLFSVLVGSGAEIGDAVTGHDAADVVSFTGSTRVGRGIVAQNAKNPRMKRLGLELGGNAPLVVLGDADLAQACDAIVFGRFLHQGQICMSTNRVLVDAKAHDELAERLMNRVRALPFGDPADPATVVGPLMNRKAVDGVMQKVEQARRDGATQWVGGEPVGNVVPPHLFTGVQPKHALSREEIFGPVLPVLKFDSDAQALEMANDTEYGLASAVFTADAERGERFAHGIRAGMTSINEQTVLTDIYGPFGGEKNSGFGHFNGAWIVEEFTRPQWITTQLQLRKYPF